MNIAIYLDPAMVPATLRSGYAGRKFKAFVTETVTINSDAGLWSGGSRDYWSGIDMATGETVGLPGQSSSPFNSERREHHIKLKPGFAVVRQTTFRGNDHGLTFYIHPDNAARMLPAPAADLTVCERLVLKATKSFKSSYGGEDRYQIASRDYGCKELLQGAPYPSREEWNAAKATLIDRKLLNKAGAITQRVATLPASLTI